MSQKKYKIKYEDIINIAQAVVDSDHINKPGLVIEYSLDELNHKLLNEDLYYRTKSDGDGVELIYYNVIELTVSDINFKFIKEQL